MLRNDPGLEIMNSRVVIQINILDFLLDWNPFHRKFRTKVHSNFGRIMANVLTSLGNLGKTKKRQTSNATGGECFKIRFYQPFSSIQRCKTIQM